MTRILVIGKQGQVGWELLRTLAPLGQVIALDRGTLDLSNSDSIRAAVRDIRPTVIVNAAAYTAVDKAESDTQLAMAINANAPGVMAEEAKKLSAMLVHFSTDYIFDGTKSTPYDEADRPNPLNAYGWSKLAGEDAIKAIGGDFLIFRTSWVYGWRGKNFLLTMLRLAKERSELRVVKDQVGCPTWSRMIAEVTAQVIGRLKYHPGFIREIGGIYNLSSEGQTNWYDFARAILRRLETESGRPAPNVIPIATEEYPLPAKRPRYSVLSKRRLCEVLEIEVPRWEDSLDLCLDELFAAAPVLVSG